MDWSGFFTMGGYAPFVWPAYGLAALVVVGLVISSLRFRREQEGLLAALGEAVRDDAANEENG
ncbi:MAG: heme exporter protein CcmD [Alphaproteobacteria bacterium]